MKVIPKTRLVLSLLCIFLYTGYLPYDRTND